MKNFFKNVDLENVTDQLAELKDQIQEMKFRKPWSKGSDTSPMAFLAIGAAMAGLGMALYKNRSEVANFCSNCGTELKGKWESFGMKDKAEQIMGKMKPGVKDAKNQNAQANYQPT